MKGSEIPSFWGCRVSFMTTIHGLGGGSKMAVMRWLEHRRADLRQEVPRASIISRSLSKDAAKQGSSGGWMRVTRGQWREDAVIHSAAQGGAGGGRAALHISFFFFVYLFSMMLKRVVMQGTKQNKTTHWCARKDNNKNKKNPKTNDHLSPLQGL